MSNTSDSNSDGPSTPLKDKRPPLRLQVHDEDSLLNENRKAKDADRKGAPMDSNLQEEGNNIELPVGFNSGFIPKANPDLNPRVNF